MMLNILSGEQLQFSIDNVPMLQCQEYLQNLTPFMGQNSKRHTQVPYGNHSCLRLLSPQPHSLPLAMRIVTSNRNGL